MTILESRYQNAIEKIGVFRLQSLPKQVKEVLKKTTDLEVKVEMLEEIAQAINK